jgi:hypothetical protein
MKRLHDATSPFDRLRVRSLELGVYLILSLSKDEED